MGKYIIGVKFNEERYSKVYDFKYECEVIDIGVGDTVVVETGRGLQLAKVHLVIRLAAGEEYGQAHAWVIQKVDMTAHEARKRREAKAKEIKKKLDDRRKKLEDIAVYQLLAEKDPDMAALLEEYKEVLNG